MKKYHQLLLLIVSLVSLLLLLVYRHQYNRLHYVLEVFNFFGQPCNFSDLQESPNILSHHDWGPVPIWQENENIYAFSAFWSTKSQAKAIVLAESSEQARSCYLWFENKDNPVMGKFKYSKIEHDQENSLTAYFYYCSLQNNEHIPYAVSFSGKTKKPIYSKKISLTNISNHKPSYNSTICVAPNRFNKRDFIEFLSYHQLIGIESFIFYSDDIPFRLTKIMSNLAGRLGIDIAFFPFNFPRPNSNLIRKIVEIDCALRTIHETNNVITLSTNEYLASSKYTFNEVLSHFDEDVTKLSVPIQTFCIKYVNPHSPIAIQNTDVHFINDRLGYDLFRKPQERSVVNTQQLTKEILSVHKYIYCPDDPQSLYSDKTVLKYSTDFVRSTLIQLLMHNQI